MDVTRSLLTGLGVALFLQLPVVAEDLLLSDDAPLRLPPVGSYQLRVLSPTVLELTLVTGKASPNSGPGPWNFVGPDGQCHLPAPQAFAVTAGKQALGVKTVGFRRRVVYAPLKKRDLRVGSYLYLQLDAPVPEGGLVEVKNPDKKLWPPTLKYTAQMAPLRWSPVLHANQTGYLPAHTKKAMVGYYLGSLGELQLPPESLAFKVIDVSSNRQVFEGKLTRRADQGFTFPCYAQVWEADFTGLKTPGQYRVAVPGLGASFPFFIGEEVAGAFARTYALGIYHQRCGTDNALPFTRFTHGPCHVNPAEIPTMSAKFASANESLNKESANFKDNPRHTAPQLKSVAASLYPFVSREPVDVRGGHHDAGDYSKYTVNSAGFIHHLVFAADAFPGVAALDNLGLPESGDGKSDVLQEAKWEADFLAKMQDADGGFYFLVYPRGREYESDVTPDKGDPQVVFPKTTAVTAAATAALAQCASSPAFKKQFPDAARMYLERAKKGWDFLARAIAKYGKDGAYQKITHYGDEYMHDDELTWAACELYLATGEDMYQKKLLEWLNPTDPNTRRWGWWRLYEAYGCAIRSYAFAARTGRLKKEQLNQTLLEQCEDEIAEAGQDQLRRAQASAYGTSFPLEAKRFRNAGWYFSCDAAFDLAVACQIDYPAKADPRAQMLEALISNLNYEEGCNPVNVTYLTGLGWKRQREIVHQYAMNDRRVLPPTGIPLGNVQAGFGWNNVYEKELDELSFPRDGAEDAPYPFYDRWGDAFNLSQEFVILNQARGLGCLAWLMAQTPLKDQAWKSATGRIRTETAPGGGSQTATLEAPGVDLAQARIVWEVDGQEPAFGAAFRLPPKTGAHWVEAEAQLPDGRRVFAVKDLAAH